MTDCFTTTTPNNTPRSRMIAPSIIIALPTSDEVIESLSRYDFRDKTGHPLFNCMEFRQLLESIDKARRNLTLDESEVKEAYQ